MLSLIVLSVVLLLVVIFALQNPQAVTIRFLLWQLESSLARRRTRRRGGERAGFAELFELAKRLLRWTSRDSNSARILVPFQLPLGARGTSSLKSRRLLRGVGCLRPTYSASTVKAARGYRR
jgi:hypothetical protein